MASLIGTDQFANIPSSAKHFPDGSSYKIEIPSVESPALFDAVIAEAKSRNLTIHRVSQGSGIMLMHSSDIEQMLSVAKANSIELCLFVGPRAEWDIGAQAFSVGGASLAPSLRGSSQLNHAIQELINVTNLGLRSVLVADIGLLKVIQALKKSGELPSDLVVKTSAVLPSSNPATARLLEDLGANSINVSADLSLQDLSEIRQSIDATLDLYIESPDSLGGLMRYYDIPEIVRIAAPVYLKFGLRNAPSLYPFGKQLEQVGIASVREKVRRAAIGIEIYERQANQTLKSDRLKGGSSP
jgi:hypothetical protein